ncbi:MAG: nucleotide exchange factor GrpE [Clostridia bacterium]|nr:nucleotide exchange factor GrpE [Clostridia bacterium]
MENEINPVTENTPQTGTAAGDEIKREDPGSALNEMCEAAKNIETFICSQLETKDAQIDRLHAELSYYKQDQAQRFEEQLLKAVIKILVSMKKTSRTDRWNDMTADEAKREYLYAADDIADMLTLQNVDEFESGEGDDFDASRHQAAKAVTTPDKSLDKKIKRSLAPGFERNGKVMIFERVEVFRFAE